MAERTLRLLLERRYYVRSARRDGDGAVVSRRRSTARPTQEAMARTGRGDEPHRSPYRVHGDALSRAAYTARQAGYRSNPNW
jgi:hypothetical protein